MYKTRLTMKVCVLVA